MDDNEKRTLHRVTTLAFILAMAVTIGLLTLHPEPARGDTGRPTWPATCRTIDQAQCTALLTNTWDGRQVTHELAPVPACPTRYTMRLEDRLDRKNAKLRELRERLAAR